MFIPGLPGEMSGDGIVGRDDITVLAPRSFPNASSSADEFSALTDVPVFLGYMLSYILTGIMLVQVFLYYLYFRRKDHRFMKFTVLALFLVECISSVIATAIVIYSIITQGYLSYSILVTQGFVALAVLSGVASSMVHAFYCWRIHVLGGHWAIIVVIMVFSIAQCVMVSVLGSGALEEGDILGSGTTSFSEPYDISYNVIWLGGSALCDIMIATTIVYLQNRIMTSLGTTSPLATRVERVMSVTIDTGMITAIGAGIELLFYLILRDSLVHFCLFYPLPKLYANCLMATLNARIANPEQGFRETTFIAAELSNSDTADGYSKGRLDRQTLPSSIQIKIQEATTYRSSVSSSIIDIKRRPASFIEEYPTLAFNAVATKRSSILDLKTVEPHRYDPEYSVNQIKLPMEQQESHPPHYEFPQLPSVNPSSPQTVTDSGVTLTEESPDFVLPEIARHSVMRVDLAQHTENLKNRRSVRKSAAQPRVHHPIPGHPEHQGKEDTSFTPVPNHPASAANILMPWEDAMEFAEPAEDPVPSQQPPALLANTSGQASAESNVETHVFPVHLVPLRAPEATLQPTPF